MAVLARHDFEERAQAVTSLTDILHARNRHRWTYWLRRTVKAGGVYDWNKYEGLRNRKGTWSPGSQFLSDTQIVAYDNFFVFRKDCRSMLNNYTRMRLALL